MKKITSMVFFGVFGLLVIYDIYAIHIGGTESSISSVLINFSYKMPMFTFFCGFICGHLFWRMRSNKDTMKIDSEK